MASDQVFKTLGILRHLLRQQGALLQPCPLLDQSQRAIAEALKTLDFQLVIPALGSEARAANRDLKTAMLDLVKLMDASVPSTPPAEGPPSPPPPPRTETVVLESGWANPSRPPTEASLAAAVEKKKKKKRERRECLKRRKRPCHLPPSANAEDPVVAATALTLPHARPGEDPTDWHSLLINDPEFQQMLQGPPAVLE